MKAILCGVFVMFVALAVAAQPEVDAANIEALLSMAGRGDRSAQHALCYRFLYGEGVEKNYPNAAHWCRIAANSGAPGSQTLLAEIYYNGYVAPVDYEQAFALYSAAAHQGHPHAQYMLGKMYFLGQGTNQDPKLGIDWLKRAAAQGYGPAIETVRKLEASSKTGA
jgi:TPR repeat protein